MDSTSAVQSPRRAGRDLTGGAMLAGVALSALVGLFIGLGAYTFSYAEGTSYLSNDPRACVNCHIMRDQYDGWQKASHHAAAACNDCHVPHDLVGKYAVKVEHGWRHSKGFTLNNFHEPIRITPGSLRVVEDNCLRCHAGLAGDIAAHASEGHDQHSHDHLGCVRCHSQVGHGPIR